MADKFDKAMEEVDSALKAHKANFGDASAAALKALRLAVLHLNKSDPATLNAKANVATAGRIAVFLGRSSESAMRKGQILEVLKTMVAVPMWAASFKANTEDMKPLLDWLRKIPETPDIAMIKMILDPPAPPSAPATEADVPATSGEPAPAVEEAKPILSDNPDLKEVDANLERALSDMKACNFEYRPGSQEAALADKAMEGLRYFNKGISRITAKFVAREKTVDPEFASTLTRFDPHWPEVLTYLSTIYKFRAPFKAQCLFLDEKLTIVSEKYKLAREPLFYTLPWAPAPPPGYVPPGAGGGDDSEAPPPPEEADAPPTGSVKAASIDPEAMMAREEAAIDAGHEDHIPAGQVCGVVWLDGREVTDVKILQDAGLRVYNYVDKSRTDEKDDGVQRTQDFTIDKIFDDEIVIVGLITNAADAHRQLLRNVYEFCIRRGKGPPFLAACSMRGTIDEFKADGIKLGCLTKDRVVVMNAVVGDYNRRKALPGPGKKGGYA